MPATAIAPGDVQRTVLGNGVRVVSERMPHVRSVSVGVWISTGSRHERPEENGICHFIEHMLFKGTRTRSAEDIARAVDSIGGNLDAFTAKELVSFNTKVLDEHLAQGFEIVADLVLHPTFCAEDLEREKGVILEELKMEADNPEYQVHEVFAGNFWKDHPLGKPILGTKDTVRRFDRDMIASYYSRNYVGANIVITAAGNLVHEQIVDFASQCFAALPPGEGHPNGQPPATHARISVRHRKSLEQVHVCLGVPSYPLSHADRFGCYVLNTVLGGGMSSRLFQNIRERQGMAYSVFSELNPYSDTGCLCVYAGTSLDNVRRVIASVVGEFARLKDEYITEDELRRAIDYLKGSLMLSLESTSSRMSNLARQELYFARFFSLDELVESIERVSRDDVMRIARTFFDPRAIAVSVLGSVEGLRLTRDNLAC